MLTAPSPERVASPERPGPAGWSLTQAAYERYLWRLGHAWSKGDSAEFRLVWWEVVWAAPMAHRPAPVTL